MSESPTPQIQRRRATRRVADGEAPRRGRPPGSRNKRSSGGADVGSLTRRIQALVRENDALRAKVKDLEASFRKIEKALTGSATRTRPAQKSTGRRRGRPPRAAAQAPPE